VKLAILANDKNSYIRPLAEGLARMAAALGATAEIHYDGIEMVSLPIAMTWESPRRAAGRVLRLGRHRRRFSEFVARISDADVVVVVSHIPVSVSRRHLQNIEVLRDLLPDTPIVNYDLVYLPTVDLWSAAILRGDYSGMSEAGVCVFAPSPFGMERYDWYLAASVASEIPMPTGEHPYSHIGIDIADGTLYPDQGGELRVLVDFEQTRKNYLAYRDVQLRAVAKSGLPFRVLEGEFSCDEIRAIYRTTGILMLAHRESFGLPICELQACGSLIFTPRPEWAGAHWIKPDVRKAGPGRHSRNFVVYRNDVEALVDRLHEARDSFDPARVLMTFEDEQPHLLHGNLNALANFLTMVEDGTIHSRLHPEHAEVGK
jgi:hypothetical protein